MVDNGIKTASLNAGEQYTIPAGYHNGNGKVTANNLASQTSGTADAGAILTGRTAWVNGEKLTGYIPNLGGVNKSLNCGESYTIQYGYHNGSGKVTANSLSSQTSANARASHILTGYNAWVNGSKINGSMPNRGAAGTSLNAGGSYTIPAGYHNGSGKVTANSLASQTSATAIDKDILYGKTAWVNGKKIDGMFGYGMNLKEIAARLDFTRTVYSIYTFSDNNHAALVCVDGYIVSVYRGGGYRTINLNLIINDKVYNPRLTIEVNSSNSLTIISNQNISAKYTVRTILAYGR